MISRRGRGMMKVPQACWKNSLMDCRVAESLIQVIPLQNEDVQFEQALERLWHKVIYWYTRWNRLTRCWNKFVAFYGGGIEVKPSDGRPSQ